MELIFLDENFRHIRWEDSYVSLLWIERYWEHGEFELICAPTPELLSDLYETKYLALTKTVRDVPHMMVMEGIQIAVDPLNGDLVTISGRSLESMLDYRIVWDDTLLMTDLENAVFQLIDEAIINPSNNDRWIDAFTFAYTDDERIWDIEVATHFRGESLHEAISALCRPNGVGFSVIRSGGENGEFVFQLRMGVDRGFSQTDRPTIAFTTDLDNLKNANYQHSVIPLRNICQVLLSEGGGEKTVVTARAKDEYGEEGYFSGIERREMYHEAALNMTSDDIEQWEKEDALVGKGESELARNKTAEIFDGEVDSTAYVYGDDYHLGDILEIRDNYGHSAQVQVVEMVYSCNSEGAKMFPMFDAPVVMPEQGPGGET
jgi:hypothetical protein